MTVMVENLMQQDTMVGFIDVGGVIVKLTVPYLTTCQWEGAVVGTLDQTARGVQIPNGYLRAQNWEQRTWVSRGGAPLPIGPGPVGAFKGTRPPGAISYLQLGNFSRAAGAAVGGYGSGTGGNTSVTGTLVHKSQVTYPADTLTQLGSLLGADVPAGVSENGGLGGTIWRCLGVVNCQSPPYYLVFSFSTIGSDSQPVMAAVAPNDIGKASANFGGNQAILMDQTGLYFLYAKKIFPSPTINITAARPDSYGVTYTCTWSLTVSSLDDPFTGGTFDTTTDGICAGSGGSPVGVNTTYPGGAGTVPDMPLQATYGYTLEGITLAQDSTAGEYPHFGLDPYYSSTFLGSLTGTAPNYTLGGIYTWDVLLDNSFIFSTQYFPALRITSNDPFPLPPAGAVFGTPLSTATFIPNPPKAIWATAGTQGGGPSTGATNFTQVLIGQ